MKKKVLLALSFVAGFFLTIQSKPADGGDFTTEYCKTSFIPQGSRNSDEYKNAITWKCRDVCLKNGLRKKFTGDVQLWYKNGKPNLMRCGCHAEEVFVKAGRDTKCEKYDGWYRVGYLQYIDYDSDDHSPKDDYTQLVCHRPAGFDYSLKIKNIGK